MTHTRLISSLIGAVIVFTVLFCVQDITHEGGGSHTLRISPTVPSPITADTSPTAPAPAPAAAAGAGAGGAAVGGEATGEHLARFLSDYIGRYVYFPLKWGRHHYDILGPWSSSENDRYPWPDFWPQRHKWSPGSGDNTTNTTVLAIAIHTEYSVFTRSSVHVVHSTLDPNATGRLKHYHSHHVQITE